MPRRGIWLSRSSERKVMVKEETGMAKSRDIQKSEKKKPQKTAKEKKQAKQEKNKG